MVQLLITLDMGFIFPLEEFNEPITEALIIVRWLRLEAILVKQLYCRFPSA
jgi:hypothetical protein